jgi:hypothetical protein
MSSRIGGRIVAIRRVSVAMEHGSMYFTPMLTHRGTRAYLLLVVALLSQTWGCAKRCRQGSTLSNGRCVQASSSTAGSGATQAADSGSTAAGAAGSSTRNDPTVAVDATAMQSAGSKANADGNRSDAAAGDADASAAQNVGIQRCMADGASRCRVDDPGEPHRIESCIEGNWKSAQVCGSDEACVEVATGQASCAPVDPAVPACDGLMCNGNCVPHDEKNCGSCGHDCTQLPHVSGPTTCESGTCSFPETSCEPGFAHCTSDSEDGCETSLSDEKNWCMR